MVVGPVDLQSSNPKRHGIEGWIEDLSSWNQRTRFNSWRTQWGTMISALANPTNDYEADAPRADKSGRKGEPDSETAGIQKASARGLTARRDGQP